MTRNEDETKGRFAQKEQMLLHGGVSLLMNSILDEKGTPAGERCQWQPKDLEVS